MDWTSVGAFAEALAAIAAVVAIGWGVFEFRRRNRAELDARIAELLGVSLTYKLQKPRKSEARDGTGRFSYLFTIHNPGRLPINSVSVMITYPGPVCRVHSDDDRTVDPAEATYEMYVASVAAHGQFTWQRDLKVPVELWSEMRTTTAVIEFRSPDLGSFTTQWPQGQEMQSKQLVDRIRQQRMGQ